MESGYFAKIRKSSSEFPKEVVLSIEDDEGVKFVEEKYNYKWAKWSVDDLNTLWVACKEEKVPELEWVALHVRYLDGLGERCFKKLGFIIRDGKVNDLAVEDINAAKLMLQ